MLVVSNTKYQRFDVITVNISNVLEISCQSRQDCSSVTSHTVSAGADHSCWRFIHNNSNKLHVREKSYQDHGVSDIS